VQRTALLRQLIQVGGKVSAIGYDETLSVEALFAQAEQELFRVTQQSTGHDFESLQAGLDDYFAALATEDEDLRAAGLLTGYYDLDILLDGGFHRGNLILLAARPGMGKTALALSCALNMARAGYRVGFISLEMGRREVIERLVAMVSGVSLRTIRAGNLEDDDLHQVMNALGALSLLHEHFFLDYAMTQQVSTIQAKVRRLHKLQPDVDIVFLDYLQLVDTEPSQWRGNRVQEVGAISRGLKQLGLELDLPVVALSQLSRAVEGRTNKVPMLSDLRESGELEQNADVVAFVYRDEVYDKQTDKAGIAELYIAKHRQGCTGVVPLRFDGEHVRFQNLERGRTLAG
jgi:replicative DNA helicase